MVVKVVNSPNKHLNNRTFKVIETIKLDLYIFYKIIDGTQFHYVNKYDILILKDKLNNLLNR